MMKSRSIRVAIGVVSLLLIAGAGLFLGRNYILHYYVDHKIKKLESLYGLNITYTTLSMPSLTQISVLGLSVVPENKDTLMALSELKLDLHLSTLLSGHTDIAGIYADGLNITLVKRNGISNYDFLFRRTESPTVSDTDYGGRVRNALDLLYRMLPEDGELKRMHISLVRDSSLTTLDFRDLIITESRFTAKMQLSDHGDTEQWMLGGKLNRTRNYLEGYVSSPNEMGSITVPYINQRWGASIRFHEIRFSLNHDEAGSDQLLKGEASVNGLNVFHHGLSPDTIRLDRGRIDYYFTVNKNSVTLNENSLVTFNRLQFHPYIRLAKQDKWHLTARVQETDLSGADLFASLPKGLFHELQTLRVEGRLNYDFLVDIDWNHLDSLQFHSELKAQNFRLMDLGDTGLTRMNGEFEYTAYEDDRPVRTFMIGPSNPNFRRLDQISPFLLTAVQQSEDGSFYHHDGFYPGAIREALIYDLKSGRFARGGSSITMQIVKNVFLNKHKNIARKLEEALIVWLIESQHLTSKDRLLEVYMNIIEWAPGIYGAAEASHFYFGKEPSDLTAQEAIFLVSLIPRPKHFRSLFNPDVTLKESLSGYFHLLARRLTAKGLIDELEADSIRPVIDVRGPARLLIQNSDTLRRDSLNDIYIQKCP